MAVSRLARPFCWLGACKDTAWLFRLSMLSIAGLLGYGPPPQGGAAEVGPGPAKVKRPAL